MHSRGNRLVRTKTNVNINIGGHAGHVHWLLGAEFNVVSCYKCQPAFTVF